MNARAVTPQAHLEQAKRLIAEGVSELMACNGKRFDLVARISQPVPEAR